MTLYCMTRMDLKLFFVLVVTLTLNSYGEGSSLLANLMHQAKTLQHGLELADKIGNLGSINGNGVGFHAYATSSRSYSSGSTIKFKATKVNEGKAYNTGSCRFTAPYSGLYGFSWSIKTYQGKYAVTSLMKNSNTYQTAYCYNSYTSATNYNQCSQTAIAWLQKGDQVWIRSASSSNYAYATYTTFSGWKI